MLDEFKTKATMKNHYQFTTPMLVIGDQGTSQFVYHFIGQGEKIIIGVHLKPRNWLLVIGDQ